MSAFMSILLAAVLIEAIINIVQNVREKETSWKYWSSLFLGLLVSIVVSVNWGLDLFKMAGFPEGQWPIVGAILTGLILSRGSNVVADLIGVLRTDT